MDINRVQLFLAEYELLSKKHGLSIVDYYGGDSGVGPRTDRLAVAVVDTKSTALYAHDHFMPTTFIDEVSQ